MTLKILYQTNIVFNCGCGFKTIIEETALEHVNKSGHVMTVAGSIKPVEKIEKGRRLTIINL